MTENFIIQISGSPGDGGERQNIDDYLVTQDCLQKHATQKHWTYNPEQYPSGYPRVAAILNSDADGRFCRRFGYLRTRVLLSLQRDLTNMEDKLQELDEKDDEHVRTRIFLWSQQEDRRRSETCEGKCPDQPTGNQDRTKRPDTRQALLRDIKEKLEEYDKFLSQIQEISQLPLVNSGVREAMTKKLGHDNPFIKQEFDFLYHNNDLMTLTQDSMPRWVVDIIFWMLKHRPFNWIVSPIVETNDTRNMNDAPNIRYISDERTETLVYVISRFTVAILSACLVTGPVLIIIRFRQVINDMARTWTVFGFTMFFSFIIAFSTGKDLRFVFTAVATYTGVLLVILSILIK